MSKQTSDFNDKDLTEITGESMSEKKQVTKDELNKVAGGTESSTYYYTKVCPQCKKKTLNCTDVVTYGIGVYTRESCSFCEYINSYVDLY